MVCQGSAGDDVSFYVWNYAKRKLNILQVGDDKIEETEPATVRLLSFRTFSQKNLFEI